jgi:hypothetical protein
MAITAEITEAPIMKKINENSTVKEMRSEYDFSGGTRGKHYKAYRKTVRVIKKNGSAEVTYFTQKEGSIMLDPDIQKLFPNSKSVNNALREYMAAH